MDTRKGYVRPVIESEDILEQTALQCTQSFDVPVTVPIPECTFKNNAFYEYWTNCVWPILYDADECAQFQVGFS